MKRLAFLRACPSYFGGKPSMLTGIFRHLPGPQHCPTLVDSFTGGGSCALYAKARGYRVVTNDLATRAHVITRAFLRGPRFCSPRSHPSSPVVPATQGGSHVANRRRTHGTV